MEGNLGPLPAVQCRRLDRALYGKHLWVIQGSAFPYRLWVWLLDVRNRTQTAAHKHLQLLRLWHFFEVKVLGSTLEAKNRNDYLCDSLYGGARPQKREEVCQRNHVKPVHRWGTHLRSPRFKSLAKNIRLRRGKTIETYVPIYRDLNTSQKELY